MTANTLFPGRADYVGPTKGWFGLLHHDVLYEESHDVTERVRYVREHKPAHEIPVRLHNMICLNECAAAAKRAPLYADYKAKLATLDADCKAKLATLDAEVLAFIQHHIPDCAWDGKELRF